MGFILLRLKFHGYINKIKSDAKEEVLLMNIKKEWLRRAIRTFVQAAVGYIVVVIPNIDFSDTSALKTALVGAGVSAVAAGIAAVMNADINHIE